MPSRILLVNGPNLNLLGMREPARYGSISLEELQTKLLTQAKNQGIQLSFVQSNHEGLLIDHLQQAKQTNIDFILINAASLTHTSIGLRDTLLAIQIPFIELHMTNVYARETFRHHSYLSDIAVGVIAGFGVHSYELALEAAIIHLNRLKANPAVADICQTVACTE